MGYSTPPLRQWSAKSHSFRAFMVCITTYHIYCAYTHSSYLPIFTSLLPSLLPPCSLFLPSSLLLSRPHVFPICIQCLQIRGIAQRRLKRDHNEPCTLPSSPLPRLLRLSPLHVKKCRPHSKKVSRVTLTRASSCASILAPVVFDTVTFSSFQT